MDSGRAYVKIDNVTVDAYFLTGLNTFLSADPLQAISFMMPKQLSTGKHIIRVSTDGMFFLPPDETYIVEILKCPQGFTCTQEVATVCPKGHYCPYSP